MLKIVVLRGKFPLDFARGHALKNDASFDMSGIFLQGNTIINLTSVLQWKLRHRRPLAYFLDEEVIKIAVLSLTRWPPRWLCANSRTRTLDGFRLCRFVITRKFLI